MRMRMMKFKNRWDNHFEHILSFNIYIYIGKVNITRVTIDEQTQTNEDQSSIIIPINWTSKSYE